MDDTISVQTSTQSRVGDDKKVVWLRETSIIDHRGTRPTKYKSMATAAGCMNNNPVRD